MSAGLNELTITLHWRTAAGDQEGVAEIPDSTPQDLVPILVEECKLVTLDREQRPLTYSLHLGAAQRPPLQPTALLSEQGVRSGAHVWLLPGLAAPATSEVRWISTGEVDPQPPRCILRLPDGNEVLIAPRGQGLTRGWLLDALRLQNPDAHEHQLQHERQSPYRFVSNRRAHCTISRLAQGYWVISTGRSDVATWLNDTLLPPDLPHPINNGDLLRLGGRDGLELGIVIV